ncbi:MAG: Peptide deformylase [Calditrichaeota bacterium]|nr:Peptide deformylase [Calditrichota bacterium]
MARLDIRIYGDPVLRREADEIHQFGPELEAFAADMLETMQANDGIGLAAPQVGVSRRFVVIGMPEEAEGGDEPKLRVLLMANPEVIEESAETDVLEEGCLSLPEITVHVDRPVSVKLRYQNLQGEQVVIEAEGVLAKVIQHEIDHLDGILITDYLPPLKKTMMQGRLKRLSEQHREASRTGTGG